MKDSLTFTRQQVSMAQRVLREALALPPESFSTEALIRMIWEEIAQLRAAGRDDVVIAALISAATGARIDAQMINRFDTSEV